MDIQIYYTELWYYCRVSAAGIISIWFGWWFVQLISVFWPCPPRANNLYLKIVPWKVARYIIRNFTFLNWTVHEWWVVTRIWQLLAHEQRMIPNHEIRSTGWRNHNSFLHFHEPHTRLLSIPANHACMDTDELELTQETKEGREETGHANRKNRDDHE